MFYCFTTIDCRRDKVLKLKTLMAFDIISVAVHLVCMCAKSGTFFVHPFQRSTIWERCSALNKDKFCKMRSPCNSHTMYEINAMQTFLHNTFSYKNTLKILGSSVYVLNNFSFFLNFRFSIAVTNKGLGE